MKLWNEPRKQHYHTMGVAICINWFPKKSYLPNRMLDLVLIPCPQMFSLIRWCFLKDTRLNKLWGTTVLHLTNCHTVLTGESLHVIQRNIWTKGKILLGEKECHKHPTYLARADICIWECFKMRCPFSPLSNFGNKNEHLILRHIHIHVFGIANMDTFQTCKFISYDFYIHIQWLHQNKWNVGVANPFHFEWIAAANVHQFGDKNSTIEARKQQVLWGLEVLLAWLPPADPWNFSQASFPPSRPCELHWHGRQLASKDSALFPLDNTGNLGPVPKLWLEKPIVDLLILCHCVLT